MWNDLYFIPILARALRHTDPTKPLQEAFRRIREMGQQTQYQVGHEQFLRFLKEVATVEGSTDASASRLLQSLLDRFTAAEEDGHTDSVTLFLEHDGQRIADLEFPFQGGTRSIGDIQPGLHTLLLDTGRVIWESVLTEGDLLWARAFPGQPLELAAGLREADGRPTITETLLEGEIVLRVFAGVEAGQIAVEVKAPNSSGR